MNLARDLQMVRSERLAQLQAPFPAVHWLILTILASTLVIAYHNVAVQREYLLQWDLAAMAYKQGCEIAQRSRKAEPILLPLARGAWVRSTRSRKRSATTAPPCRERQGFGGACQL